MDQYTPRCLRLRSFLCLFQGQSPGIPRQAFTGIEKPKFTPFRSHFLDTSPFNSHLSSRLASPGRRVRRDICEDAGFNPRRYLMKRRDVPAGVKEFPFQPLVVIDAAILAVEKEAARLANMKTWTETIQSNSGKILEEVRKMADNLEKQIVVLRDSVETLRRE